MIHRGFVWGAPGGAGRVLVLLLLLAVAGAAVAALVLALRDRRPHVGPTAPSPGPSAAPSAARSILDERYARGEIDDEEYRRRRSVLGLAP